MFIFNSKVNLFGFDISESPFNKVKDMDFYKDNHHPQIMLCLIPCQWAMTTSKQNLQPSQTDNKNNGHLKETDIYYGGG